MKERVSSFLDRDVCRLSTVPCSEGVTARCVPRESQQFKSLQGARQRRKDMISLHAAMGAPEAWSRAKHNGWFLR